MWEKLEVAGKKVMHPGAYANELVGAMKWIHKEVGDAMTKEAIARAAAQAPEDVDRKFKPGDYVLLRAPPASLRTRDEKREKTTVSDRLLPLVDPVVYRVGHLAGRSRCHLVSADTGKSTERLDAMNPIQMNRLVFYDLSHLEAPLAEGKELTLVMQDRNGINQPGRVTAQTATGLVRVCFDKPIFGDFRDGLYNLAQQQYYWTDLWVQDEVDGVPVDDDQVGKRVKSGEATEHWRILTQAERERTGHRGVERYGH
jgi:hypothetical protein